MTNTERTNFVCPVCLEPVDGPESDLGMCGVERPGARPVPAPRYQLRKTKKRYSICKLAADTDFDPPVWVELRSWPGFKSPQTARAFMLRHGERP